MESTCTGRLSKALSRGLILVALLLSESVLGFVPRLRQTVIRQEHAFKPTRLFIGTLPDQKTNNKPIPRWRRRLRFGKKNSKGEEEDERITNEGKDATEDESAKQSGMDALHRLLSRQEAEIEETKRLLELYESAQDGSDSMILDGEKKLELMSVASSILKGFDYGFQSRSEGPTFDKLKGGNAAFIGYGPPANVASLTSQQFMRNLNAMMNEYEDEKDIELTPEQVKLQDKLQQLTLSSAAIWERELKDGPIEAPLLIKFPYLFLCYLLDTVFEGKYVPSRFFLLETVARMPYFSYISMLHLYETLGFWRRSADVKRIHFAEELNEFRHLLIMESYGGDQRWWVRLMAQHSALAYYIGLCVLFMISPSLSYKFSELLETHAVNTYSQFLDENEELLKELPPSLAAVDYYVLGASDPYYAEFQTTAITNKSELRRPGLQMESMFDVFSAIRDDEGDHVSTMEACLDPNVAKLSPSLERKVLTGIAAAAAIAIFLNTGADITIGTDVDIDSLDTAVDSLIVDEGTIGLLDAAMAGAAGALSQLGAEDGETNLAAGLLEKGAQSELGTFLGEIAAFFAPLL